jgi:hypothetical protein
MGGRVNARQNVSGQSYQDEAACFARRRATTLTESWVAQLLDRNIILLILEVFVVENIMFDFRNKSKYRVLIIIGINDGIKRHWIEFLVV